MNKLLTILYNHSAEVTSFLFDVEGIKSVALQNRVVDCIRSTLVVPADQYKLVPLITSSEGDTPVVLTCSILYDFISGKTKDDVLWVVHERLGFMYKLKIENAKLITIAGS